MNHNTTYRVESVGKHIQLGTQDWELDSQGQNQEHAGLKDDTKPCAEGETNKQPSACLSVSWGCGKNLRQVIQD